MAPNFVLIHGAGGDAWYWHRLAPLLRDAGHDVVAPDLPVGDDAAGLAEYVDVVLEAAARRTGVVLVAQSLGGFTAPLVAGPLQASLLVMLNAMLPYPGEPPGDWWSNTGWDGAISETEDEVHEVFLHDVPAEVAAESEHHGIPQSGTWRGSGWTSTSTRSTAVTSPR